jgi:hypothetical protein
MRTARASMASTYRAARRGRAGSRRSWRLVRELLPVGIAPEAPGDSTEAVEDDDDGGIAAYSNPLLTHSAHIRACCAE